MEKILYNKRNAKKEFFSLSDAQNKQRKIEQNGTYVNIPEYRATIFVRQGRDKDQAVARFKENMAKELSTYKVKSLVL